MLPDRGQDIGVATFAGLPLAFCTPALWEAPRAAGGADAFAQRFGAGLLTTCGLDQFGPADRAGAVDLAAEFEAGAGWP